MDLDLNTLSDTYLRQYTTKRGEDLWAWQEVDRIVRSCDLGLARETTLLLLRKPKQMTRWGTWQLDR